jgi:hypothetical protein
MSPEAIQATTDILQSIGLIVLTIAVVIQGVALLLHTLRH